MIIWSGATISLLGLVGLIWCILKVSRAKRANLGDDAMRDVLKSALPLNLGAVFVGHRVDDGHCRHFHRLSLLDSAALLS